MGGEPGGLSGPVQRALRLRDSTLEHEKGVSVSNILLVGHGQCFSSDTHSVLPGFFLLQRGFLKTTENHSGFFFFFTDF